MVRLLMSSAVAVALAGFPLCADATVATRKLAAELASQNFTTDVAWKCGSRRCFWDPAYSGPVPGFAANWGPPDPATCYYVKGRISKRWRMVCPEVPWQAR